MSREPYPCTPGEFWETETPNADRDGSARPIDRVTGKLATVYTPPEDVVRVAHKASPAQVEAAMKVLRSHGFLGDNVFRRRHLAKALADAIMGGDDLGRLASLVRHVRESNAELPQPHGPFTRGYETALRDVERTLVADAVVAAVERPTGVTPCTCPVPSATIHDCASVPQTYVLSDAEMKALCERYLASHPEEKAELDRMVAVVRPTVPVDGDRVDWYRADVVARAVMAVADAEQDALRAEVEHWKGEMEDHNALCSDAEDRAALSGPSEPTCGADITHRDDDHRQSVCVLPAGHASAHDDGQGCRWTDAEHHEQTGSSGPHVDCVCGHTGSDHVLDAHGESRTHCWRCTCQRLTRSTDGQEATR